MILKVGLSMGTLSLCSNFWHCGCAVQMDVTEVILMEQQVLQLQNQQGALLREILPQQVIEHLLEHKLKETAAPGAWRGWARCTKPAAAGG